MKLAYLCSSYPAVSHTFVLREVAGLRRGGIDVHTFSIRRAATAQLLSDVDRAESRATTAILPTGVVRLLSSHASALLRAPYRYCAALSTALWRRPQGMRAALWQLFYFAEAGILATELRRRDIRHVHAHFANVAANVARLASTMNGGTWSVTLHGLSDFADPSASGLRDKIHSAAFVICVSDFGRSQAFLLADQREWSSIHRVHCGIDTDHFAPSPGKATAQMRTSALTNGAATNDDGTIRHAPRSPVRLLTVARLGPEKGHSFLLDALAEVRRANLDVTLTLVGDGPLRGRLEQQVRELKLESAVSFAGAIGQDRILDYYHSADVFILPSLAEGLPVVLMEAMACGVPVVATRISGIPELVSSGVSGTLVTPGRADLLAEAIAELARAPDLRARFARAGRDAVVAGFDQRATSAQLSAIYATALGDRGAATEAT